MMTLNVSRFTYKDENRYLSGVKTFDSYQTSQSAHWFLRWFYNFKELRDNVIIKVCRLGKGEYFVGTIFGLRGKKMDFMREKTFLVQE